MERVDIPRAVLIEAVATATEHARLPREPARKLRDFARYAESVGSNFSTGCPMQRTGLYFGGGAGFHPSVEDRVGDQWVRRYDDYLLNALPTDDSVEFIHNSYARVIG